MFISLNSPFCFVAANDDLRAWAEDWDDDEVDDAFAKQLRAELVSDFVLCGESLRMVSSSHVFFFFRPNRGMWHLLLNKNKSAIISFRS